MSGAGSTVMLCKQYPLNKFKESQLIVSVICMNLKRCKMYACIYAASRLLRFQDQCLGFLRQFRQ